MDNNTPTTDIDYTFFPIKREDLYSFYELITDNWWFAKEIDSTTQDVKDFHNLDKNSQQFLEYILAFFAVSDGIVVQNLAVNMIEMFSEVKEAEMFYSMQIAQEMIHAHTYSRFIEDLITNTNRKNELYDAVNNLPAVKAKYDWANKYIKEANRGELLIAFAILEGVFFSSSFCAIFWLASQNILKVLKQANEFISRDEGLHRDFAVTMYNNYLPKSEKLSTEKVIQMVKEAMEIEYNFINEALDVTGLMGMNRNLMKEYVEFTADMLLVDLGIGKIYNASQPFPFMDTIGVSVKTNFFESRSTNYKKPELGTIELSDF